MRKFEYDVFLSHASTDKTTVRQVAEVLRDRGLRVWFDEESLQLGDHIYSEIENGIERSRILIFFASKQSLASDWVRIERSTAVFRDPTNANRRFLVVRLDKTRLPDVIAGFLNLAWPEDDEAKISAAEKLISACSSVKKRPEGTISYHDVFTPGAPPSRLELLVGRDRQLQDLLDYLNSPGTHPIVIGDRGIGKTSLVRAAVEKFEAAGQSIVELNTIESFDECCRIICDDLGIDHEQQSFSPASLLRILKGYEGKAIVSIDELDDMPEGSDTVEAIAKFAKAASNQSKDLSVKFVFSGISSDAHDVFQGHLSSDRNLPQVRLTEISSEDLAQFLERAGKLLGVKLSQHAIDTIVTDADGFPYYVHQVAFHTYAAFEQDANASQITERHLTDGRARALQAAFAHYLRRYKHTIYKLTDLELLILQQFLTSYRRRLSVDSVKTTVAETAKVGEEAVRQAMWELAKKDYLRWRKGDKTLALKDGLLRPFLSERLSIRATPRPNSNVKGIAKDQLDLF